MVCKTRAVIILIAAILVLAMLAGCGGKPAAPAQEPKSQGEAKPAETPVAKKKLSFATGSVTGTYYPIGAAIAKIISTKVPGFEVTAEATGASVANLKMLRSGNTDIAMAASNTALAAFKGEQPFDDGAVKNMRSIMALYPEVFQFLTTRETGLKHMNDLKGKKVVVGPPGSGTERTARLLLELHGLTFKDIKPEFMSYSDGVTALKDKLVDAVVVGAGIPTSAMVDASTSMNIELLDVDPSKVQQLIKSETYLMEFTIPKGTYKGIDRDVPTIASPALLLVQDKMDEKTAYDITKAVLENVQTVAESHAQGKSISLENAVKGVSIEYHPGAKKYLVEKGALK